MQPIEHTKVIAENTDLGPVIFADYYRFGAATTACPLVVYVGGAITENEYRQRIGTEPLPVIHEFTKAFEESGFPGVDLLVLPFPPEPDGTLHEKLFSILLFELLRQTPNPRPEVISCVGYSLGASFASYLTFSLVQVRGLAVIGGYGMAEAARQSRMLGEVADRCYQAYWNADSRGYMENLQFLHFLTKYDASMEVVTAEGDHDYADYAANGSVRDAFGFVLKGMFAR